MKTLVNSIGALFFGSKKRSVLEEEQIQSPIRTIIRNFLSNKIALTGLCVFCVIALSCIIVPFFLPLDLSYQDVTQQNVHPGFSMSRIPKELANNVKQIDIGSTYSVGISKDGKLYQWGQLDKRLKDMPALSNVKMVSAGLSHALALTEDGQVVTWGLNRFTLDKIPDAVKKATDIVQIEAANQISLVVEASGKVHFWGNTNLVDFSIGKHQGNIAQIASTTSVIMGLTKDGNVVVLGNRPSPFSRIPENMGKIVAINATDQVCVALNENGTVFVWGNDLFDLLKVPEAIQGKTVAITAGRAHIVAMTNDGLIYSWGRDNFFQTKVPSSVQKVGIEKIYAGYYQSYAVDKNGKATHWGLKGYLLGTDDFGRDIFLRMMAGGRLTLSIGGVAVIISIIIGIIVGGFSGYYGGKVDMVLMRIAEVVGSLPFLPLAMILSAIIGNKMSELGRIYLIMLILGVLGWTGLARLVRAQILSEREKEFVTAAKAMGIREGKIIFRHILPNVITVVIVSATISFAYSLLTESTLSFLGFGIVEPRPTWGNMLTGSQSSTVIAEYWWRWVFPALILGLATISINLIGDGLRDAIDPKSNER